MFAAKLHKAGGGVASVTTIITTKTALMQTAAKATADAAQKAPLQVSNISQLRDLAASAARASSVGTGTTSLACRSLPAQTWVRTLAR
jgi:hypothetical protein